MKKLGFLVVLIIFLKSLSVIAQTLPTNPEFYKAAEVDLDLEKFRGTKYFDKSFQEGTVNDKLSGKSFPSYIRYDILNDLFEIKQSPSQKKTSYLQKTPATTISFDNHNFIFTSFRNEAGNDETGYLELLGSINDIAIYARHYSDLRLPEKAKTTLENDRKGLISNKFYYLKGTITNSSPVDIDKKSILTLFEKSKRTSVAKYMKSNRNKARNIQDVVDILNYAESID